MKNTLAIVLIMLTTACATAKKRTEITMTPQELADAFEYRDNKISDQIEKLRKDFDSITKKMESLRSKIAKQVEDCLCPGEMK